ncbi:hypothetical protein ILUMI_16221 [Ignelater luminosus]|uniref:Reverse transcriptase domain-containing protein n=1 Tax=Ignelater luminosus TaxID=2038154 RepID=A0A8K0CRG1_IGNLU|nr:hypothetical protein ILUMI_16221 [Ignelater luminosus]
MGIPISYDSTLYTLHFADDQMVLAHNKDLKYMTRKLIEEYKRWGLKVKTNKTKYMCVGGKLEDLELENSITFKRCEGYTYLGVKLPSEDWSEKEVEERIRKGRKSNCSSKFDPLV